MEFIIPCGVLSHRNVRKPHCTTICCRGTSWAATESSLAPAGATLCKRRVKGTERRGCSGTLGPQSEQSAGDELWFSYIFIWKLGSKAERLACSCCDSMLFRLKLCCEVNANAYWLRLKFVISLLDSDDRNPAQSEGWSTLRRTCVFFSSSLILVDLSVLVWPGLVWMGRWARNFVSFLDNVHSWAMANSPSFHSNRRRWGAFEELAFWGEVDIHTCTTSHHTSPEKLEQPILQYCAHARARSHTHADITWYSMP